MDMVKISRKEVLETAAEYKKTERIDIANRVMDVLEEKLPKKATIASLASRFAMENISDEDKEAALERIRNYDGHTPTSAVQSADKKDNHFADFLKQNTVNYLLYASEEFLADNTYFGEVFGVGDENTGYYYLLAKNESFLEVCENKAYSKVGLIVTPSLYRALVDKVVKLEGYDFFGAYVDNQWMFYQGGESCKFMNLFSFGWINDLFSRNTGLFESKEMLEKYAIMEGCGSVGSLAAMELARAGVGTFLLVDKDVLKLHNVCRHQLGFRDLGRYKADALKEAILNINPNAKVICFHGFLQDAPMELFDLGSNGILVGTADDRKGNAFGNALAEHLQIPFVAIGCWTRAYAGEVFYWEPGKGMPTYQEAFADLIDENASEERDENYFGMTEQTERVNFEPGTSVDLGFVTNIGLKLCLDLINRGNEKYTPRVIHYLTHYTMVCNTNEPAIGGENAKIFPHPLFISDNVHLSGTEE